LKELFVYATILAMNLIDRVGELRPFRPELPSVPKWARATVRFLPVLLLFSACSETRYASVSSTLLGCVTDQNFSPRSVMSGSRIPTIIDAKSTLTIDTKSLGIKKVVITGEEEAKRASESYYPGDLISVKMVFTEPYGSNNFDRAELAASRRLEAFQAREQWNTYQNNIGESVNISLEKNGGCN
jgi:hypothetical protein